MDKYAWLKDVERKDPKVLEFLRKENERTERFLEDTKPLRERLIAEYRSRIAGTYETYPYRWGRYYYNERYEEGKNFTVVQRRRSLRSKPEVILDWNALAEGHEFFAPGGVDFTKDGRYMAYAHDTTGAENFTLYVKDMASGRIVARVEGVSWGEFLWTDDNRLIYVLEKEGTKRPYRVMLHIPGTDPKEDREIFRDDDDRFFVGIYRSKDGYVFATSGNTGSNITTLIWPHRREFFPRKDGVKYWVYHGGDRFYILTNEDAPNYRVLSMDERTGEVEELIPENPDEPLEDIEVFRDFLALEGRYEGLKSIRIYDLKSGELHRINFREPAYYVTLAGNYEYETSRVRIYYTSLRTPPTIYEYDVEKRRLRKRWTKPVPNYDPKLYKVERIWATSYDGTKVPITVAYRKDRFRRDRRNPLYLVGYGAYGSPNDAGFSITIPSLLDRGFIFAIAHVRGGGEFGERWHQEGKLLKKRNTIYDFVEAAEYMIIDGWTEKGRIAIQGASAGGITVGGALNLKPYLFGAAVAIVPFVDVLNTMLDPSLPLTVQEYDEWGNPKDSLYFRYIRSYSPYDNVKPDRYPPILAMTSLYDVRVGYWEPAKWVLKLRESNRAKTPILLWTDMSAGHAGKMGRYQYLEEVALRHAFVLKVLGRSKM